MHVNCRMTERQTARIIVQCLNRNFTRHLTFLESILTLKSLVDVYNSILNLICLEFCTTFDA